MSENADKRMTGLNISKSKSKSPQIPTELLIRSPADVSISKPLDKKFPTMGTELLTTYLVALNIIPSNSDDAEL